MALPLTRGGHEGGGTHRHSNINPEKAEHGRAVHCYATASGPMRGSDTSRVTLRWWEQPGIDWEKAKAKETETEATYGSESETDTEGEEEREEESRASGSSGA